jgi:membrane-associated phospholipid phosphatase
VSCLRTSTKAQSCAAASAVFVATYALANQLTSLRSDIGTAVFDWESAIPFVAWTIVPYLSIGIFFVLAFFVDSSPVELRRHVVRLALALGASVVCYAVCPLHFMFDRPPVEGVFHALYAALTWFDLPYNRAPSLHIAVLVVLWARLMPGLDRVRQTLLGAWFVLIGVSVLTTYQHHVIDVLAGLVLGAAAVTTSSLMPVVARATAPRRAAGSL